MNRPPTPDVRDEHEKEATLQEIISVKVSFFYSYIQDITILGVIKEVLIFVFVGKSGL